MISASQPKPIIPGPDPFPSPLEKAITTIFNSHSSLTNGSIFTGSQFCLVKQRSDSLIQLVDSSGNHSMMSLGAAVG